MGKKWLITKTKAEVEADMQEIIEAFGTESTDIMRVQGGGGKPSFNFMRHEFGVRVFFRTDEEADEAKSAFQEVFDFRSYRVRNGKWIPHIEVYGVE